MLVKDQYYRIIPTEDSIDLAEEPTSKEEIEQAKQNSGSSGEELQYNITVASSNEEKFTATCEGNKITIKALQET